MPKSSTLLAVALPVGALTCPSGAAAAEPGEAIVGDNVGLRLYTHNFDSGKTTTIDDKILVSEFMGAHVL